MRIRSRLLLSGLFLLSAFPASAAVSPVGIGLVDKIEFPPEDFTIAGVRASVIYGSHRHVYGFDLGAIGNMTLGNFSGLGVSGGFNMTKGVTTVLGVQVAGITNLNLGSKTRIYGVQIAGLINSNPADCAVIGLQIAALANLSPHGRVGFMQVGLYNTANEVYGFQIGLINKTERLYGLQIGLLNFHRQGLFTVSPILNVGF